MKKAWKKSRSLTFLANFFGVMLTIQGCSVEHSEKPMSQINATHTYGIRPDIAARECKFNSSFRCKTLTQVIVDGLEYGVYLHKEIRAIDRQRHEAYDRLKDSYPVFSQQRKSLKAEEESFKKSRELLYDAMRVTKEEILRDGPIKNNRDLEIRFICLKHIQWAHEFKRITLERTQYLKRKFSRR